MGLSKTAHPQRPEPWGQSPEGWGAASGSAGPTPPAGGGAECSRGTGRGNSRCKCPQEGGSRLSWGAGRGAALGSGRCLRRWWRLCERKGLCLYYTSRQKPPQCPVSVVLFLFFILWWGWCYDQIHDVKCESYLEGKIDKTRWQMGEGSRLQAQRKGGPSQGGGGGRQRKQEERGPALI